MLRITMEIVPHGIESKASCLGIMVIANDGTGDSSTGNYNVVLERTGKGKEEVRVFGYERNTYRLGPWHLLYRALKSLIKE